MTEPSDNNEQEKDILIDNEVIITDKNENENENENKDKLPVKIESFEELSPSVKIEKEKEAHKIPIEKSVATYTEGNKMIGESPPRPLQVAMTPSLLDTLSFPECEEEHPDCFIHSPDEAIGKRRFDI